MLNDGRGFNDAFEEQIGLQAESKQISMLSGSFLYPIFFFWPACNFIFRRVRQEPKIMYALAA